MTTTDSEYRRIDGDGVTTIKMVPGESVCFKFGGRELTEKQRRKLGTLVLDRAFEVAGTPDEFESICASVAKLLDIPNPL